MSSFAYKPSTDKAAFRQFFELLPFVLPCKFCRSNLIQHYEALPLEPALQSRETLTKWLYEIHNGVNATLRSQGKAVPEDPPFSAVKQHYEERLAYGCSKTFFPGWEFLFSIVEAHPLVSKETPLPEAPPKDSLKGATKTTLLKWNYLSGHCRFQSLCRFWGLLGDVLPFPEWRSIWKRTVKASSSETWKTKASSLKTLWFTRKTMEDELALLNKTTYHDLCKMIRYYKSGCAGKATRTCRRLTSTRKQKRD
jgi:hypothetical protein